MHGKFLMVVGLAVSGATVVGTVHPGIPAVRGRLPRQRFGDNVVRVAPNRRVPDPRQIQSPRMWRPAPPAVVRPAPWFPDDAWLHRLQTADGRTIALPWQRGFRDSTQAALARDSLVTLLAPGHEQLACDLEQQPRYVRTLSLLVANGVLIEIELRRARAGLAWSMQPAAGYLLLMRAGPLDPARVRRICDPPLGRLRG